MSCVTTERCGESNVCSILWLNILELLVSDSRHDARSYLSARVMLNRSFLHLLSTLSSPLEALKSIYHSKTTEHLHAVTPSTDLVSHSSDELVKLLCLKNIYRLASATIKSLTFGAAADGYIVSKITNYASREREFSTSQMESEKPFRSGLGRRCFIEFNRNSHRLKSFRTFFRP